MKKNKLLWALAGLPLLALAGCGSINVASSPAAGTSETGGTSSQPGQTSSSWSEINSAVSVPETSSAPVVDVEGDFSITTSDGTYAKNGSVYSITAAGTYTLAGELEGQILIEASEDDEVVLELNGVEITYGQDSPIKAVTAGKVEISAKKDTSNNVIDTRSVKTVDVETQGEGAISADCDLKLKGSGTLVVTGSYNNGVHTTKDLTIQKQTLYVTAPNNALKGKDSITMTSGDVTAISKNGNGLKSEATDLSSKSKQRGTITISGGTLLVDSCYDGIDAAYDLIVNEDNDESLATTITVKTGKNSKNSANYKSSTSAKGLKAANSIQLAAGTITVQASDDAVHANYGDTFESGGTGLGNVSVSGANLYVASGDDGVHADNTFTISNGVVVVSNAGEGIEANHLAFEGGSTYVYGTDDGINASKKINQTPTVVVSGGYLDVSIGTGDTDGIDSNGNFSMTGGFVVTRGGYGSSGGMSTGLDCDGTASITGGTFISFNGVEMTPTKGSNVLYAYYGTTGNQGGWGGGPGGGGPRWANTIASSNYKFSSGTYTLSGGSLSKTFKNEYAYSSFLIYSSELTTNTAYTLQNGSTTVLSWTQSSASVQIS